MIGLILRPLARRLGVLFAFTALFLAAAVTARVLTGTPDGHVDLDRLFVVGGAPLASTLILFGWVIGRFPVIAVLVLMAGLFSHDRSHGFARLYAARPVSLIAVYGLRFLLLAGIAFTLSVTLVPLFDIIIIGSWAGPSTLVLSAAYVLAYGALVALLSVWTRYDSWIALALAFAAIVFHALRTSGTLGAAPPGVAETIAIALPPQGALSTIETAFAQLQPVPWTAFSYVLLYSAVMLLIAALFMTRREI